jgi:hypothetical protein
MRIGLSTSVIGRGKTGIGQYVFALTRALLAQAAKFDWQRTAKETLAVCERVVG